jgi:HK97 family phage major capsid protein
MLVDRVMRAFAEHAATGGGTSTPQGVTIGGTKGADAAVSSITYDNLVDLQHSVDKNYRKNGTFMFNDNTLKVLRKLKDDQGRPIFQESMRDGEPSTILGKPYVVDNDMPDIGASAKSIAFGDFNKYIVRRVRGYSVKRLTERYADNNQTGFLLFVRLDGRILDAGTHPIKYLQHAAA